MNTLEDAVSLLKRNSDLVGPLTDLLRTHERLSTSSTPGRFADAEAELIQAHRQFSCASQAGLLQAWDDPAPDILVHQGQRFERTRRAPKTYQGLDGDVRVTRWLYTCPETAQTICPMEMRAGLAEAKLTPAAARLELVSAASDDYRKACEGHRAAFVLGRSKSSLERDVVGMGARLAEHLPALEEVRQQMLAAQDTRADVASISVSVDRTGLPFEEELERGPGRPRKGAPKTPCKVVKRQNYCACLTLHDDQGEALSTQRFAALPDKGDEVVGHAGASLRTWVQAYPEAKLVGLCDGAAEMRRRVREIAGELEFDEELVDAWHASSYVSQAFAQLGKNETWRKEMVRRFINNKNGLEAVLMKLRTAARLTHPGLDKVEEAVTYLENNGERMRYARARDKGLPIGSGNVEATCKCVVAVRFKRSGARWKPQGAEPLLHTRAWLTSDAQVWWPVCDAFLDTYVTPIVA